MILLRFVAIFMLLIDTFLVTALFYRDALAGQHTQMREQMLVRKLDALRKAAKLEDVQDVDQLMESSVPIVTETVDASPEVISNVQNIQNLNDVLYVASISVLSILVIAVVYAMFTSGGSSTGADSATPDSSLPYGSFGNMFGGYPLYPDGPMTTMTREKAVNMTKIIESGHKLDQQMTLNTGDHIPEVSNPAAAVETLKDLIP